jgi:hypothetical protein
MVTVISKATSIAKLALGYTQSLSENQDITITGWMSFLYCCRYTLAILSLYFRYTLAILSISLLLPLVSALYVTVERKIFDSTLY